MAEEKQAPTSKAIAQFAEGMLDVIQSKLTVIQKKINNVRVSKKKILELENAIPALNEEKESLLEQRDTLNSEHKETIDGLGKKRRLNDFEQNELYYPVYDGVANNLIENEEERFKKEKGKLDDTSGSKVSEINLKVAFKQRLAENVGIEQKQIISELDSQYTACVNILKGGGFIELLQSLKLKGNTDAIDAINKALKKVIILLSFLKETAVGDIIINVDNAPTEIWIPISEETNLSEILSELDYQAESVASVPGSADPSTNQIGFCLFVDILNKMVKDLVQQLNSQYENIIWESIKKAYENDPEIPMLAEGADSYEIKYQVLVLESIFGEISEALALAEKNHHLMPSTQLLHLLLEGLPPTRALTMKALEPVLVFLFYMVLTLACASWLGGAIATMALVSILTSAQIAFVILRSFDCFLGHAGFPWPPL